MKIGFKSFLSLILSALFFTGCTALFSSSCHIPTKSEVVWEISMDDEDSYFYWDEVLSPLYGVDQKRKTIELLYVNTIN